eukprot:GEMP01039512.1.p1 GENE.GEMP01039512.1~~GEMP01039512.1.p1  ORF type:complete len:537 (-),score=152.79 GEMP01039512.1:295-1905(-)
MKFISFTKYSLLCTHAWSAWEKAVPLGSTSPYFTNWGPLNALLTDEKISICVSTLGNTKASNSISECIDRVQSIAIHHEPLRGLSAEQVRGVCERLALHLASLSSLATANQQTASDVCASLSDDRAKVEEEGREATCEAVRRLLSKGVLLESVCSRLSLADSCLDDLKKGKLRGTTACDLGLAMAGKNAPQSGAEHLLSAWVNLHQLAAERFERVCVDTVGKLRSSKVVHSLRERVDPSELLFWNDADEAVLRECATALVLTEADAAVARHVCWDLATSFVTTRQQELTSGDKLDVFCRQYFDWFSTSSYQVSDVIQAPIRFSSSQLPPPPAVPQSQSPNIAAQPPTSPKNVTTVNIATDTPDDDTVTSVEDAEAKAKAATDKASRIAKHEHTAKVDAENISAKAAAVKLDAEAMEKTEVAAKKEAEAIAKKASDAKADADSLARKAYDAQIDAQKIAEKASEANTDVQVIEKNTKDANHDAKELSSNAESVGIAARRMAHTAAEAAQNATKWEKKVSDLKTSRVKDEHIPMSSWA